MYLSEDKQGGGSGGLVLGAKEERPFIVYAPVQTDKSVESVTELRKEISELVTTRPATQDELDKVKTNQILKLPGQWETNSSINSSVAKLVRYNLPDDYYQQYDQNVRNLSIEDIRKVSKQVVDPDAINWFMLGDRAKIVGKLDELGFDNIIEIDADGNRIVPSIKTSKPEIKN